jgi:hypothetical protein
MASPRQHEIVGCGSTAHGFHLAVKRSHFSCAWASTVHSRGASNGDQESKHGISQNASHRRTRPVGGNGSGEKVREFVRRDVVTNPEREPENESELVASNINSVLQRVTATLV